jgi:hypothetical protein
MNLHTRVRDEVAGLSQASEPPKRSDPHDSGDGFNVKPTNPGDATKDY